MQDSEPPTGHDPSGALTYWQPPKQRSPPAPVSRRRYVVAILFGAIIVFTSANALIEWFHVENAVVPAFALGVFAAGWNTKARTIKAWILVGILTIVTAIVLAFLINVIA
jgi:hypothetical protein